MQLDLITIVVQDYHEAVAFFVDVLRFKLAEDREVVGDDGQPKRWVVLRPGGGGTGLLLARATTHEQAEVVGRQTGGRVGFFLRVNDFEEAFGRLVEAGTTIDRSPREEPYGRVAVFRDVCGNRWDLLGPS